MTSVRENNCDEQLFHAIGKFFVTLSHLFSITEHLTAALVSKDGDEKAYRRARIAVSNLTAQPLSNAFFSVLKEFETQNWTEEDQAILKQARRELDALIAHRNRFAHDTWHLGHPNLPRPAEDSWHRIRTLGTQNSGLRVDFEIVTVDFIQSLIIETKRIDANIRQLSLSGIGGDTSRPEVHFRIIKTESGQKQLHCIRDIANC